MILIRDRQAGTPWSDGVPGLSQKPIAPGGSFLYKWTATQYGTYWYVKNRKVINVQLLTSGQVSRACEGTDSGWSLRAFAHSVCSILTKTDELWLTRMRSPPPNAETPFSLITNNTREAKTMQRLDRDPTVILLSDWDHFTSEEYQAASRASNLDLL